MKCANSLYYTHVCVNKYVYFHMYILMYLCKMPKDLKDKRNIYRMQTNEHIDNRDISLEIKEIITLHSRKFSS